MEFIPRLLAKRFSYFESVSGFILWPLWFVVIFAMMVSLAFVNEETSDTLGPFVIAFFLISLAGITSARHFARKAWVPTNPLIVQFTSKAWFNSIISILGLVSNWSTLVFVHVLLAMTVFYITAPVIAPLFES
ncbi:hypothetical protein TW85_19915 [Marinomonas sp. S3726]|uniref:hypothetical protein n=1 Tax=Marinomonas sp. S3726 TaxID=579484 RepID=UPI0005FA7CC2|nr:hypothetical protein [Marinomonas sp. S3726]KJZ10517.1 hypothetical protein TW85_19915 [Marinomonas sp. S3726]